MSVHSQIEELKTLKPPTFVTKQSYTDFLILGIIVLLIMLWIIKVCCRGVNFTDVCRLFGRCCSRCRKKEVPENSNEVISIQQNDQNLMSLVPLENLNNEVIVLDCGDQIITDENIQQLLNQNGSLQRKDSRLKNKKRISFKNEK